MPTTAARLRAQIGAEGLPVNLGEATGWGLLRSGGQTADSAQLFPRVDVKKVMKELAKRDDTAAASKSTAPDEDSQPSDDDLISIDDFFKV